MTRSIRALLLTTAALLMPFSVSADSVSYKEGDHYKPTTERMAKNTSNEQIEVHRVVLLLLPALLYFGLTNHAMERNLA